MDAPMQVQQLVRQLAIGIERYHQVKACPFHLFIGMNDG